MYYSTFSSYGILDAITGFWCVYKESRLLCNWFTANEYSGNFEHTRDSGIIIDKHLKFHEQCYLVSCISKANKIVRFYTELLNEL